MAWPKGWVVVALEEVVSTGLEVGLLELVPSVEPEADVLELVPSVELETDMLAPDLLASDLPSESGSSLDAEL